MGTCPLVETIAAELLTKHGFSLDAPPGGIEVACAMFGDACIRRVPSRFVRGESGMMIRDGVPTILIADDMRPERVHFAVTHRLATLVLRRIGRDRILSAESLAAALIAPARAFLASVDEHGCDVPALAAHWCLEQTAIVLRIAETTQTDAAVVGPRMCRRYAPHGRLPADPATLRQWAGAHLLRANVTRVRLTDAPRVALLAA